MRTDRWALDPYGRARRDPRPAVLRPRGTRAQLPRDRLDRRLDARRVPRARQPPDHDHDDRARDPLLARVRARRCSRRSRSASASATAAPAHAAFWRAVVGVAPWRCRSGWLVTGRHLERRARCGEPVRLGVGLDPRRLRRVVVCVGVPRTRADRRRHRRPRRRWRRPTRAAAPRRATRPRPRS